MRARLNRIWRRVSDLNGPSPLVFLLIVCMAGAALPFNRPTYGLFCFLFGVAFVLLSLRAARRVVGSFRGLTKNGDSVELFMDDLPGSAAEMRGAKIALGLVVLALPKRKETEQQRYAASLRNEVPLMPVKEAVATLRKAATELEETHRRHTASMN